MNCRICAKQYLCNKKECNPIKFSQTKDYGEVRRIENENNDKSTNEWQNK